MIVLLLLLYIRLITPLLLLPLLLVLLARRLRALTPSCREEVSLRGHHVIAGTTQSGVRPRLCKVARRDVSAGVELLQASLREAAPLPLLDPRRLGHVRVFLEEVGRQ